MKCATWPRTCARKNRCRYRRSHQEEVTRSASDHFFCPHSKRRNDDSRSESPTLTACTPAPGAGGRPAGAANAGRRTVARSPPAASPGGNSARPATPSARRSGAPAIFHFAFWNGSEFAFQKDAGATRAKSTARRGLHPTWRVGGRGVARGADGPSPWRLPANPNATSRYAAAARSPSRPGSTLPCPPSLMNDRD